MSLKATKSLKPVKPAKKQVSEAGALDSTTLTPTDLHSLICNRAYEIFLQRGTGWGNELDDWLLAEQEIVAATQTLTQAAVQTKAAEPISSKTKTRKTTARPPSVKASKAAEKRSPTRARKKPSPEV